MDFLLIKSLELLPVRHRLELVRFNIGRKYIIQVYTRLSKLSAIIYEMWSVISDGHLWISICISIYNPILLGYSSFIYKGDH
jgi:hypothetical protein